MCNMVYSKSVNHYQTLSIQSTCAVKHCKQNWGDPGGVTVADIKLADQLLEEDADSLGEGVGEAGDDEAAGQHCPAPAAVWRLHAGRPVVHHCSSHDALRQLAMFSVAVNTVVKDTDLCQKVLKTLVLLFILVYTVHTVSPFSTASNFFILYILT